MNLQTIELTPSLAAELLQNNLRNRPLSRAIVKAYAEAMRQGHWQANGTSIVIDTNNNMIDGQHRCAAVVLAGVAITIILVTGVDPDAFKTLDAGKKRTASDSLSVLGEKHANNLAAAAKAYKQITTRQIVRSMTSTETVETLEECPALRYWTNQYASRKRAVKLFTSALAGALCAGADVYGSDAMLDLLTSLETGEGLKDGDPALVLRERFITRKSGQFFTGDFAICLYVKTIAAYGQGRKIKLLRVGADEPAVPSLK